MGIQCLDFFLVNETPHTWFVARLFGEVGGVLGGGDGSGWCRLKLELIGLRLWGFRLEGSLLFVFFF